MADAPITVTFTRDWRGQKKGNVIQLRTESQIATGKDLIDQGILTTDDMSTKKTKAKAKKAKAKPVESTDTIDDTVTTTEPLPFVDS